MLQNFLQTEFIAGLVQNAQLDAWTIENDVQKRETKYFSKNMEQKEKHIRQTHSKSENGKERLSKSPRKRKKVLRIFKVRGANIKKRKYVFKRRKNMTKTVKRITAIVCAAIMAFSMGTVAFANDTQVSENSEKAVFSGEITAVTENQITVGGRGGKALNVGETTIILNDELNPIEIKDVKEGMFAIAVHSAVATFSLPAQTGAYYIVVSESVEQLPLAAIVESVEKDQDGNTIINSTNEMYSLYVTEDTQLMPLRTRNIVRPENFSKGDVIFFYVEVLTMSIPAQGSPSKIILVEDVLAEDVLAEDEVADTLVSEPSAELDVPAVEVGKVTMTVLFNEKLSDGQLSVTLGAEEILLNIDENTIIMDDNFFPVDVASIKKDTPVYVVNSPAMTASLPAQTYAYALIVSESGNFPIYVKVANVSDDKDGNKILTSADGNYEVSVPANCAVSPMRTRNILSVSDLSIGDELFVFPKDGVMSLSLPALVSTEKIVVWVDNVETDVYVAEDGTKYYPLRKICEENGLSVTWNNDTRSVQVGTTAMGVYVTIGKNEYTFARMMPRTLSGAPILIPDETNPGYGITYVPGDFFTEILGIEVK